MQILNIRMGDSIYDVTCRRSPVNPQAIQIMSIDRFNAQGLAEPVQWSDLTEETQNLIQQDVRNEFSD